jgi:hypothetical protein
MTEKEDKFAIFSKKFAELDGEGQDRLIAAAQELLMADRNIQNKAVSPLSDADINARLVYGGFSNETGKFC